MRTFSPLVATVMRVPPSHKSSLYSLSDVTPSLSALLIRLNVTPSTDASTMEAPSFTFTLALPKWMHPHSLLPCSS
eukprot:c29859_g1_i1 orf=1-225(-)